MGSLNPVFVTPGALAARAEAIATGYVGSFTQGVGKFCTKPGLLFLPRGHGLDDRLAAAVREVAPARMLVPRIAEVSRQGQAALAPPRTALTGCAIGEILGLMIGTALGLTNAVTTALAVALTFLFGYTLSTLPLIHAGASFGARSKPARRTVTEHPVLGRHSRRIPAC